MLGILEELFGPAVEKPQYFLGHVWGKPAQIGHVYPCAYLGKPEFDTIECAGQKRYFILVRDLRDTLVSAYFSIRNTHEVKTNEMAYGRQMLTRLNKEEGLLYLMESGFGAYARVQRTWRAAGAKFYHLEDCMADAPGMIGRMLEEGWGVRVDPDLLKAVADRHSFAKLSGGRAPGQEDLSSHYRKGLAGDWQSHFTPALSERFQALFGDLLDR
jgi:hypothetical protein